MDILIKSFNRPYYLDRCLRSIYQHVQGEFTIKILDDGTPDIYLAKIQADFPDVQLYRSPGYARKATAIERHLRGEERYAIREIPADFWCSMVEQTSRYFLLTEDDIWLTRPVDTAEMETTMAAQNMVLLKLTWQGNPYMIAGEKKRASATIEQVIPAISRYEQVVFLNKYKVRSVLYRLGFFRNLMKYQVKFYTLYSVAAACFEKDYWLSLWQGVENVVLEETQLGRAYAWFATHRSTYGKLLDESTQTSYISSTANSFQEISFDMFRFNHCLNEAWLEGKLNVQEGYPKDFSVSYLKQFLGTGPESEQLYQDWLSWIERFKAGYRKVGCEVE
jgi:glycosyltransferase involved in cell wall biosynthesis